MSDPLMISNDGRLIAVQDTIETVDLMFTDHRDLMPVAMCRVGRVLTPDERVSFGLESTSPDLVNPAISSQSRQMAVFRLISHQHTSQQVLP